MKTPDPNNDIGNVIPEGWELDPVWGNINGAIKPIAKPTDFGAPRPDESSPLWNDWAANNPTPEACALGGFDFVKPMLANLTGIAKGARPIDR